MAFDVDYGQAFSKALQAGSQLPMVKIEREKYLRRELSKFCEDDVVDIAIESTPATAGISPKIIEQIAKSAINYETSKVTALSAGLGLPGGFAMLGTIPADAAQFFGHVIRITQKLAYLHGWPDFGGLNSAELDDATANELTLFIGVMFGVNAANQTLRKIATLMGQSVPKRLVQQALTKGTIYPIVKRTATLVGARMTKQIFSRGVGKLIPVLGGVVAGGVTFAVFKPMSRKLQKYLQTLPLAGMDNSDSESPIDEDVDIDFTDIDLSEGEDELLEIEAEIN